jgi:hypothetical protein
MSVPVIPLLELVCVFLTHHSVCLTTKYAPILKHAYLSRVRFPHLRFADGAAIGQRAARMSARATGCDGTRTATLDRPART